MPRDASETRDRLLAAAERIMATRGVDQATTREIVAAAGQRNASALTYHFRSRGGVLRAILLRHGTPLDEARADLAGPVPEDGATRHLVASLVIPYAGCLGDRSGRHYLRIVAQLTDRFPVWRVEGELSPPHLRRILGVLEQRVPAEPAVARERVVGAIMLMTTAAAERARVIEHGQDPVLGHDAFAANLTDMLVALIEAPAGSPVLPAPAVTRGRGD